MSLKKIGEFATRWVEGARPWTDVYGTARSLLALATASTLIANPAAVMFRPVAGGIAQVPLAQSALQRIGFFALFGEPNLELARWVAAFFLLIVASGWRPRITAIPHWWISLSLQMNAVTVDGGDQLTAVLTLLLLPIALTDSRAWHWQNSQAPENSSASRRLIAVFTLLLIRIQVAGVYFHAAVGKFAVAEWANGTALYYWILHPGFGAADWLSPIVTPLLVNGYTVVLLTWGVMASEYALSLGLFVSRRAWPALLTLGIGLHVGIVLLHGLVSFSVAMFAALILYLRPAERTFGFASACQWHLSRRRDGAAAAREAVIIYDGNCSFCRRTARVLGACDLLGKTEWLDLTDWSVVSRRYPQLDEPTCRKIMHAVFSGNRIRVGFDAYRTLCWYLPAFMPFAPLLYLPGVTQLGRRVYQAVSGHRDALACGLESR